MRTIHCRDDYAEFYHGSCTLGLKGDMLLPPEMTDTISEKGRKKNLDRVFFTKDRGLAKVYARRAARSIGGEPTLFRVIAPVDTVFMSETPGATVYHAAWAFVEQIPFGKLSD